MAVADEEEAFAKVMCLGHFPLMVQSLRNLRGRLYQLIDETDLVAMIGAPYQQNKKAFRLPLITHTISLRCSHWLR